MAESISRNYLAYLEAAAMRRQKEADDARARNAATERELARRRAERKRIAVLRQQKLEREADEFRRQADW
jgi:hypothetical protein